MLRNIAAVDIGTNSFHLVVVRCDTRRNKFRILDREKEIVRLGSGSTDMKHLSAEAVDRAVTVLKRFRQIARARRAPLRAVGTSAVREALNRGEFIRRARVETGIEIDVVSGPEEARLIHLGVLQALPVFDRSILLMDIGGGSTEFLAGKGREILYSNSLKLGAIRLTRRFFAGGRITPRLVKKCRKYVAGTLIPVVRDVRRRGFELAVGSSGTILNTLQMVRALQGSPPLSRLNGLSFTRKDLSAVVKKITAAGTPRKLLRVRGLDPQRADIITAGVIILEQAFEALDIREMTVSEFALREGIVLDTIEKRFKVRNHGHIKNVRLHSVMDLLAAVNHEPQHARHTADLALELFDRTRPLHGYGRTERDYLEYAALLHDIGMFVSHAQHHRHTYYLIRNADLLGFSEHEKELIAAIARYHRKSHPKPKHESFGTLAPADRILVERLASILRVADGLDRSHGATVTGLGCRLSGKKVICTLAPASRSTLELEIWGAERKKDLFEQTYGRELILRRK